ncbi:hypothetical protein [Duganella phyllosphaerae]|uniref:Uncharacterized protein n=1 Tax=Duganella phyllosphaerae TaxID=762836 RepID=A0A1E7WZJ6_9BURK|nr:hypothetical protein [Duganella phyllosphaerae]OFA05191.1 hypothetical protein DUPY_15940 [Duganella phyllosphaerae]
MTDIRKHAVEPTSILHLRNSADELLYADDAEGNPDKTRPMEAEIYGPGSKQFKKAQAASSNRMVERLKKKGKDTQSAEEKALADAEFLAACTKSLRNVSFDQLVGEALFMAVYTTPEIGFIPEQINKHIGDWSNFTKASPTN